MKKVVGSAHEERKKEGKERKGKERKGKERKGKERKGKERKGKEERAMKMEWKKWGHTTPVSEMEPQ